MSALNFIPRQAFKQLQDNDDIELYGIYIIVEHKQGDAPSYTYWKREFKTKNARATPDYNGPIGDRFNEMCEWANEARGIIFNEPKLYADSTSERRHMTTFGTQNKEYHVITSWAFPQNEVVSENPAYVYPVLCDNTPNQLVKQSLDDVLKEYEISR